MANFNAFGVTQEQVPGEPIFVAVRDASDGDKEVKAISTLSLGWIREDVANKLNDSGYGGIDPIEMYVLFPSTGDFPKFPGLVKCSVGSAAPTEPGGEPRLIVTNEIGILWSCDL